MQKHPYTRYTDLFYVENNHQILKLKISGEDRYLIKEEVPLSAVWRGDHESSVFYSYLAKSNPNILDQGDLDQMNQKLLNTIPQHDSLQKVISPLLDIVENGWYQLFYHEPLPVDQNGLKYFGQHHFTFNHEHSVDKERLSIWVDDTILFTQDFQRLDNDRVEFYIESILDGKRPTIVTLAVANIRNFSKEEFVEKNKEDIRIMFTLEEALESINPQFIIDGHHKAKAYLETGERPGIISLVKLQFKKEHQDFLTEVNKYKQD